MQATMQQNQAHSTTLTDSEVSVAVIGIGNILFSDEGLGIYATEFLRQNYQFSPAIDLIDGGTLGMNMIHYYQSYQQVLLLDTISVEQSDRPGDIYNLDAEKLQGLGNNRKTAHEIEVLQTLELGALAGEMANIQIIAMVPQDIETVKMTLTDSVQQAMPLLLETVLQQLQQLGIQSSVKQNPVSLSQVISQYDQQQALCRG